jgi:hypothetical protein
MTLFFCLFFSVIIKSPINLPLKIGELTNRGLDTVCRIKCRSGQLKVWSNRLEISRISTRPPTILP